MKVLQCMLGGSSVGIVGILCGAKPFSNGQGQFELKIMCRWSIGKVGNIARSGVG